MGTEFQHKINPLAANPKSISFSSIFGGFDDWNYLKAQKGDGENKSTVFINFEASMDKLLTQEKLESIQRTMMMHENVFKHQVRELHRLYKIQKIMMNETINEHKQSTKSVPKTKAFENSTDKEEQLRERKTRELAKVMVWEGSNEISIGGSTYIVADNTNNSRDKECDVDLTLSIGGKKQHFKSDDSSNISTSHQQSSLPHWLCQGLGSSKT